MRGKQGFRQTYNTDLCVVVAGIDADTLDVLVNTATPAGLNGTNPATIFSGFQNISLPQNPAGADLPTVRLAGDGNKFALLSYSSDAPGYTPTTSQIFVSPDTKKWQTRTLPTRDTTDALKHAWAEVFGSNGRFIVSHAHYPDLVISDNNNSWTLLPNVFAVNGFQQNGIACGGGRLLAAADDAKVIYRSLDNGATWAQVASNIVINEFSASPTGKALDSVLALTYGADGTLNVFFMLAKRNDVARYRYVLTSPDGVTWTQRLRIDLGTTGTPQEPLIASSPARTIILLNNLTTVRTLITTTSASTWTQLTSTPAANWRGVTYDGSKFVACGEPFGAVAAPIVMALNASAAVPTWGVKLTGTQKLRSVVKSASTPLQPDNSVVLLLQMAGEIGSATFVDASRLPKTVTATNVVLSDAQSKWSGKYSAPFSSPYTNTYLSVTGHPDIAVGTNDFTIEAWIWITSYNVGGAIWESTPINTSSQRLNSFLWYLSNEGRLRLNTSNADILITDTNIVPLQTWVHVALVRKNNRTAMYVDGQFKGATNTTFDDTVAIGGALIGRFCETDYYGLDGYIGEFRITKGIAQYSGNTFTVPTAPLLNYSPFNAPTSITIEAGDNQLFAAWEPPTATDNLPIIDYNVQHSEDAGVTWNTFADGVSTATTTTVTGLVNNTDYLFRVAAVNVDGAGPYATTATPVAPTNGDPLFNSVSLLLRFNETNGTFIDTSPRPKTLTANNGGATFNALSKWGDGSAFFNGGSLTTASNTDFSFGTGDFTIEFWAYPTADTYAGAMINIGDYSAGILFRQRTGGPDALYLNGNYINWNSQTNMPSNVWTHVALVREAGVVAVYANGARVLTWNNTANLNPSGTFVTIGVGAHSNFSESFNGYLDELRITKGFARYSGATADVPTAQYLGAGT